MPTTPLPIPATESICDLKTFRKLAQEANWIPVWTTVPADLLTPVSAFWKLTHSIGPSKRSHTSGESFSFLFESVEGGESIARYTFLGTGAVGKNGSSPLIMKYWLQGSRKTTQSKGTDPGHRGQIEIWEHGAYAICEADFIPFARRKLSALVPAKVDGLPPLTAGAVGYMGYDLISLHEPVKLRPVGRVSHTGPAMPDAVLMLFSTLLIFDHVKHNIWIVRNVFLPASRNSRQIDVAFANAIMEIGNVVKALDSSANPPAGTTQFLAARGAKGSRLPVKSNTTRRRFIASVKKAKDYIKAGDIFQVVLSQRLEAKVRSHPFEIYRALRRVNPAPYLFYLQMGDDSVLGSSPEMLVKVTGDAIEYRPIAGTRRRGATPEQDEALERDLLADEKELAEHTMLVDLGRNDVGRVARYGTVRPTKLKFIERYSHVMHMVSSIEGKLRPGLDAWDALLACFPAGTVSGAPKVRAMQIISELEPTRRGIYAGTVLYYDLTGNLNSCIAIRSIVVRNGKAVVQVGAGIVAESVPELEFEETLNKGRGMLAAIALAEQQFAARNHLSASVAKSGTAAGKRKRS